MAEYFILRKRGKTIRLKKVKIPNKLDQKLAEFIGIYLGDGHLAPGSYEISVVGGRTTDKIYVSKFVSNLMKNLFSVTPRITYFKTTKGMKCYFNSKIIFDFLINKHNLYSGRKINPKIPSKIFKDKLLLKACVRGLMDTDGGVHKHHKKSIQLKFDSRERTLILSVNKALLQLGFNPRRSNNKTRKVQTLYLFGEQVEKYFDKIGSSNPKNKLKFNMWKENGIMPKNSEILKFLNF